MEEWIGLLALVRIGVLAERIYGSSLEVSFQDILQEDNRHEQIDEPT